MPKRRASYTHKIFVRGNPAGRLTTVAGTVKAARALGVKVLRGLGGKPARTNLNVTKGFYDGRGRFHSNGTDGNITITQTSTSTKSGGKGSRGATTGGAKTGGATTGGARTSTSTRKNASEGFIDSKGVRRSMRTTRRKLPKPRRSLPPIQVRLRFKNKKKAKPLSFGERMAKLRRKKQNALKRFRKNHGQVA